MLGIENERHIDGTAVQLVGLLAMQQIEKLSCRAVVVCCCLNPFATSLKMVPVEEHGAKAGGQPIGDGDLGALRAFGL